MYNGLEPKMIYYDPDEKLLLVNRKNGKKCTFFEEKDSYLLVDGKIGNKIIIKQITLEQFQSYSDIDNIMRNVSSFKPPDDIRKNIDALYNYLNDEIYPAHEVPEFVDEYDNYYLHIISYNDSK